jgi:hypothetical protein
MATEKFSVQKINNTISLYAIEIIDLNKGDIFFRKNNDDSIDVLPRYENNKDYINSIIKNFSDSETYDEKLLYKNEVRKLKLEKIEKLYIF